MHARRCTLAKDGTAGSLRGHRKSSQKPGETNKISFTWNPLPLLETNKSSHFRLQFSDQYVYKTPFEAIFFENPYPPKRILFVSPGFCEPSTWLRKSRKSSGTCRCGSAGARKRAPAAAYAHAQWGDVSGSTNGSVASRCTSGRGRDSSLFQTRSRVHVLLRTWNRTAFFFFLPSKSEL